MEKPFRNTNLLITINTNQAVSGIDDAEKAELIKNFASCIDHLCKNMDNFLVSKLDTTVFAGRLPRKHVEKFRVMKGIEIGDQLHRLHAHVLVSVRHTLDDVKIDLQKIRPFLNQQCNLPNVSVKIRPVRNIDNENLRDYLGKQQLVIPKSK